MISRLLFAEITSFVSMSCIPKKHSIRSEQTITTKPQAHVLTCVLVRENRLHKNSPESFGDSSIAQSHDGSIEIQLLM